MLQHLLLPHFKRQLKKLLKKYPHLGDSLLETLNSFQKENQIHIGKNIYKIRLQSKDIPKGKNSPVLHSTSKSWKFRLISNMKKKNHGERKQAGFETWQN